MKKGWLKGVSLILLFFIIDYFSKFYISRKLHPGSGIEIIPGFFNIVHVKNTGIAFGIFAHLPPSVRVLFLGGISLVVFVIVLYLLLYDDDRNSLYLVSLAFLGGGDLGNLYDRIFKGYVVDFLDFHIGQYHYPAFNFADTFITIGIFLLFVYKIFVSTKMQDVKNGRGGRI